MKILIFVAVFLAVCGQSAVNVQADVIECVFWDHRYNDKRNSDYYPCDITSIKQDENQNVITGSHATGRSNSDVNAAFFSSSDFINLTNFDSIFCQKFPNLERLFFNNLKPVNLIENALHGCQPLSFFNFDNADIKQIPDNFFSNSLNLTHLSLSQNRLETLPENIFSGLKKLEWLRLHGNQLNYLPKNIFQSLTELRRLWLYDNNLSTLSPGLFDNLRNLTELYLRSNKIKELPKNIFVDLKKLEVLRLYENNLVTIHADSIGKLPLLTEFSLHDNKITSIDEKFIDDTAVTDLYMKGNICSDEYIRSRDEMKEKLQKCFNNYQPRQVSLTSTAAPTKGCGVAIIGQGNVIGGDFINPHAFPWIAAITDPKGKYFCGGVIVSDWKVVTAAHCIQEKEQLKSRLARKMKVLLGSHDLNEIFPVGLKVGIVQKIHLHDDWNPLSTRFDADIAVLVLDKKIIFDEFIQPICLIEDVTSPVYSISTGIVVGYGKSENESIKHENIPKMISQPIFNNDICKQDKRVESFSSKTTFCTGYRNKTGTCSGDSGNGLFVEYNDVYFLRGIVSSSALAPKYGCDVNTYSVFTNITYFINWINDISVDPFAE